MGNIYEYRSSLRNKEISLFLILGIVSEIILSKEIFKKNKDISLFLKNIFELEFKEYVMKSRTMIMSKTLKKIYSSNEQEIQKYRKNLLNYIEVNFYNKENNSKKKTNDNLSKWIRKGQINGKKISY